jgi:hypothetical protein
MLGESLRAARQFHEHKISMSSHRSQALEGFLLMACLIDIPRVLAASYRNSTR